jgi:hypothetical protein
MAGTIVADRIESDATYNSKIELVSPVQVSNTFTATAGVNTNTLAVNGNNISSTNSMMFRNRIINGDMRIDQRNAGASVTPTNGQYVLDRWRNGASAASKYSVQQDSVAPSGFSNSNKATSLSAYSVGAGEAFLIQQYVEGYNMADLAWGTASASAVTLSFWVRSSLTGTFGGSLQNSDRSRCFPVSYTIAAANTWEYKTITIPGDTTGTWLTTNGIGIQVNFSLGSGTSVSGTAGAWSGSTFFSATGATSVVGTSGATFQITGVQLEAGSVATPFERRPFGMELALCQRYYQQLGNSAYTGIANGLLTAGRDVSRVVIRPTVDMRAGPTVNFSNIITTDRTAFDTDITATSGLASSTNGVFVNFLHAATGTASYPILIAVKNNTTGFVSLSAEL